MAAPIPPPQVNPHALLPKCKKFVDFAVLNLKLKQI